MNRIQSIDAFRVIAIFGVIVIHTHPFETQTIPIGASLDFATFINQLARFSVPFYFVISGYFWAKKLRDAGDVLTPTLPIVRRISFIFLSWSVIYLLPFGDLNLSIRQEPIEVLKEVYWNTYSHFKHLLHNPLKLAMEGTRTHLWFLVALLWSLCISAFLIQLRLKRILIISSIILYLIGLAGKAYSDTPLGFHIGFNFREGPFFSLIFFVTGYLLNQKQPAESWLPVGLMISASGLALHFIELVVLKSNWGTALNQDYVIGTYFYGVGVAIIALSNSRYVTFSRMAPIGSFVLGIYASHMLIIDLLKHIYHPFSGTVTSEILYPISVFFLSYVFASMLSQFRFTKRLVV
ncbi:acyltransferase [Methylotuvimicrobium sp. KM1]|uniref:acyltransferase n=1 Tax=Methylotuvimicrobium sp. KM1 TaxID=3377707 RepID=UPI003850CC2F